MALYQFEAIDSKEKKIRGRIEAKSLKEAKYRLVQRNILPFRLGRAQERKKKKRPSKKELLSFTKELSRLLGAGLPLLESLLALEEKSQGETIQPILLDLIEQLQGGKLFSQALQEHPESFDLLFVSMIGNAEKTASLTEALETLSSFLRSQIELKKQIVKALLYPCLLLVFCGGVLVSLLFFVIPSLQEIFEGKPLHPFTAVVFAVSRFVIGWKTVLIPSFLGSFLVLPLLFLTKKGKQISFRLFSKIPPVRRLWTKIGLVRFARSSSALLEGGLPAMAAFREARRVIGFPPLEAVIAAAEERIAGGEKLHVPFQNQEMIPPLVPRMISIAQQGGKLPYMMSQIGKIYEEELEQMLAYFTALAQPILLLVLGVIIGFVLLSVLLPLTDVSSFLD